MGANVAKKWITEEDMYSIIENNNLLSNYVYENFKLIKQPTINDRNDRPDYILLSFCEGKKLVFPIEVKITLTSSSVAQMEKYLACLDNGLGCNAIMFDHVVKPVFIFQWIDNEVLHFSEDFKKEWLFLKLQKNKIGKWELEEVGAREPKPNLELLKTIKEYFEVNYV